MNLKSRLLPVVLCVFAALQSQAGTYFKLDNNLPLEQAASWTTDGINPAPNAPGAGDIACFSNLVNNLSFTLGASASWQGIVVSNTIIGGTIIINNTGNPINLGAAGIGLTNASTNLVIYGDVTLAAAQTWLVGKTLTIGGAVSGPYAVSRWGSGSMILSNANANFTGSLSVSNGSTVIWADNPLGAGTITNGSTSIRSGDMTPRTVTNNLVMNSTLTLGGSGTGDFTWGAGGKSVLTGNRWIIPGTTNVYLNQIITNDSSPTRALLCGGTANMPTKLTLNNPSNGFSGGLYLTSSIVKIAYLTNSGIPQPSGLGMIVYSNITASTLEITGPGVMSTTKIITNGWNVTNPCTLQLDDATCNLIVNGTNSLSFVGSGHLIKTGAGTLTIAAPATYTGNTTNNAGKLALTGTATLASTPIIHVAAGATFDVSGLGSGFTLGAQTLAGAGTVNGTLKTSSGSIITAPAVAPGGGLAISNLNLATGPVTLNVDLSNLINGSNGQVSVSGTLTLGAALTVNINPTATYLANGDYPLIKYAPANKSGTLGTTSYTGAPANTRQSYSVVDNGTGAIVLRVTGAASLLWNGGGAAPNDWDYSTANWKQSLANDTKFTNADYVNILQSEAGAFTNINVAVQVIPQSVLVSNNSGNIIGLGSTSGGKISGPGTFLKQGAGLVIVSNANDFTGPVVVSNGTLRAASAQAFGTQTNLALVLTNSGVLDLAGLAPSGYRTLYLGGAGFGGYGVLTNSSSTFANKAYTNVVLTTNATLGAGGYEFYNGKFLGNGFSLTKRGGNSTGNSRNGTNTTIFRQMGDMNVSDVLITNAGTIGLALGSTFGNTAGTIYLGPGRLLLSNNASVVVTKNIKLMNSAFLEFSGSTTSSVSGTIDLQTFTFTNYAGGSADNLLLSGVITGQSSCIMRVDNGGTVWLQNPANTFKGMVSIYGTNVITSIANLNTPSALGAPDTIANGVINIGSSSTSGRLKYIGAGDTTDRQINLNASSGTVYLEAAGTGPLVFTTNVFVAQGAGAKSFHLCGASTANNEIMAVIPDNSTVNKTTLVKNNAGKWILSGQSTYTGNTYVNAGTLALKGTASLASPLIVITNNGAANLDVTAMNGGVYTPVAGQTIYNGGTINGNLDIVAGVLLHAGMTPSGAPTVATNTINGSVTLEDQTQLTFDLSPSTTTGNDLLAVSGSVAINGTTAIYINYVNGLLAEGDYAVITTGSGITGAGSFQLAAPYPNVSLAIVGNNLVVRVGAGGSKQENVEWTGVTSNVWTGDTSLVNWVNQTGNDAGYVDPDFVRFGDVNGLTGNIYSVSNQDNIQVVGAVLPYSITFTNMTANYVFNAGANGNIAGSAVTYKTNAGPVTYNLPVNSSGNVQVDGGGLTIGPAGSLNHGVGINQGLLKVGDFVNSAASFTNFGAVTSFKIAVGTSNNAAGAVYQNGGTLANSPSQGASDAFIIGQGQSVGESNAFGYLEVNGGTVQGSEIHVGEYGIGMLRINAGQVIPWVNFYSSRRVSSTSVVDIAGGVLFGATNGNDFQMAYSNNAVFNVRNSGVLWCSNTYLRITSGSYNPSGASPMLNILNGGTAVLSFVGPNNYNLYGTLVNINGGTIMVGDTRQIGNWFRPDLCYIYTNGATIDTQDRNTVITNIFLAPTGYGVDSITVNNGGAGYIAPPIVLFSRGAGDTSGTNASAVALIDGNGVVTNIVITSPGINYQTAPTISFLGRFGLAGGSAALASANLTAAPQASGGIIKKGSGSLTLKNPGSTITNAIIVQNGTLILQTNNILAAPIIVQNGAFLSVTGALAAPVTFQAGAGLSPGGSGAAATMALSQNVALDTATLFIDLTNNFTVGGNVNDLIDLSGVTLDLTGTTTVHVHNLSPYYANGTYTILKYGTKSGTGSIAATAIADNNNAHQTFTVNDDNAGTVTLTISGGDALTWGGLGTDWDTALTANWLLNSSPAMFYSGAAATFDNNGSAQPNVNLPAAVYPQSVTVNANNDYTLSGPGKISGVTGLSKRGAGTLVLNTTNDYVGDTVVTGGKLVLGNNSANLGATNGVLSIDNNAVVDANGVTLGSTKGVVINAGGGILTNGAVAGMSTRGQIALNGTLTVGGNNGDITLTNILSGTGGLIKVGNNVVMLTNAANTFTGPTQVKGGQLVLGQVGTANSLPVGAATVTLNNGGVLGLSGGNFTNAVGAGTDSVQWAGDGGFAALNAARNINLFNDQRAVTWDAAGFVPAANTLVFGGQYASNTVNFLNALNLAGAAGDMRRINVTNNTAVLSNTISGAAGIIKDGPGVLVMSASNTFTGNILVNAGTLRLAPVGALTNALGGGDSVTVASGAVLDYNAGFTFARKTNIVGGTGFMGAALTNNSVGNTNNAAVWLTSDTTAGAVGRMRFASGISNAPWVSAPLTFTKTGSGQMDLAGDNGTFTGTIDLQKGMTVLYNSKGLGTVDGPTIIRQGAVFNFNNTSPALPEPIILAGGLLTNAATSSSIKNTGPITLTQDSAMGVYSNGNMLITGDINGNFILYRGGMEFQGVAGSIALAGNNTFSELRVAAGRTYFGHNHAAGNGNITVTTTNQVGNGTLEMAATNGVINVPNTMSLGNGVVMKLWAGTNDPNCSLEFSGVISGNGSLWRDGAPVNGLAPVILSGANTFTGGFRLIDRSLTLKHAQALGTGVLTLGDAVIAPTNGPTIYAGADLTGPNAVANTMVAYTNFAVGSLALNPIQFNGGLTLMNSQGSVNVNNNGPVTLAGVITDASIPNGLTKDGAGVLTLANANTYRGVTAVNAGTLVLANATGNAAGDVSVAPGATVVNNGRISGGMVVGGAVQGRGVIAGNLALNGALVSGSTRNQLTAGSAVLGAGAAYVWQTASVTGTPGTDWDVLNVVGNLDVQATSVTPFIVDVRTAAGFGAFDASTNQSWIIVQAASLSNFDPAKFQVVYGNFAPDLHGGAFVVDTNEANAIVVKFVANPAPIAAPLTVFRGINTSYRLPIADLLTNVAANGTFAFDSWTPTAPAGVLSTNAVPGCITFEPATPDVDEVVTFQYTVKDTAPLRAGDTAWTSTATVTIQRIAMSGQRSSIALGPNNTLTVKFAGIPGQPYSVQMATNLLAPITWTTIWNTNAPADGVFDYNLTTPAETQPDAGYFRLVTP